MSGTRRKPGRLGPFVDGYREWLLELGYSPSWVRQLLKDLGHLGRWMSVEDVDAARLNADRIGAFLADPGAARRKHVCGLRGFASLLGYLSEQGITGAPEPVPPDPVEELVARYRRWLVKERALAPATVLRYETLALRFLRGRAEPGELVAVGELSGADVSTFLLGEFARLSVGSAKGRVTELRSLFRFLYLEGLTPRCLADAVPPVAGHPSGSLRMLAVPVAWGCWCATSGPWIGRARRAGLRHRGAAHPAGVESCHRRPGCRPSGGAGSRRGRSSCPICMRELPADVFQGDFA
jgi:hypothetical protein